MTDLATLADRRRIGKRMRGRFCGDVAPDAHGGIRLHRLDEPLRVDDIIYPPEVVWDELLRHFAQFLVSPGLPCALIAGNRTSVKSFTLPLRPMAV